MSDPYLINGPALISFSGGRTVGEESRPRIARAYETGVVQQLLPDYSE